MIRHLPDWIYNSPTWLVTGVFLAVALVVASIGLLLVYSITSRATREQHAELTTCTVSNIAVLYAVLLAFIAVATWESFSRASDLAQTKANLAGNLFRDTRGLPAPVSGDLRQRIQAYLQVVIQREWPRQQQGVVPADGWPIRQTEYSRSCHARAPHSACLPQPAPLQSCPCAHLV